MDAVSETIDRDDNLAVHPDMGDAATPSHLDHLEAESIHIIREAVAESDNPVLLYSIGKDS
jgi:3'-phosphoadenosine 5'-phosphosulfate sulfotransferase (PAPS reductase)/FAD synthetase